MSWLDSFLKGFGAPLNTSWDCLTRALWALCLWREARSEGRDGLRAVAHVINNRAKKYNKSPLEIITADAQFTSINPSKKTYDSQLDVYPIFPDKVFEMCMEIVKNISSDIDLTLGATHYRNSATATSKWFQDAIDSKKLIKTRAIGRHDFYKEK